MSRTVSQYFNQFGARNEQRLVEDLIVETIKINGMQVYYVPKVMVAFDKLFGEDPQMATNFGTRHPLSALVADSIRLLNTMDTRPFLKLY